MLSEEKYLVATLPTLTENKETLRFTQGDYGLTPVHQLIYKGENRKPRVIPSLL